jgi:hypothetical protein
LIIPTTRTEAAFLALSQDPTTELLQAAWEAWEGGASEFIEAVEAVMDRTCTYCDYCTAVVWSDCTSRTDDYEEVCSSCVESNYYRCAACEYLSRNTTTVDNCEYCESCLEDNFIWCEDCEEYFDGSHVHGCECEAPNLKFEFPANGHGTIAQNERLTVALPAGTIDEEGLQAIAQVVHGATGWRLLGFVNAAIDEVGPTWQTKRGNFTRRLSSALHKHGIKLERETISQIGNLGRQHSSDDVSWDIEFTRDLNLPAEDFCHDGSCWWTSMVESRCCLKNWGGLGIRTFDPRFPDAFHATGRAWVLPMRYNLGLLRPTHDTMGADAYLVFNAYGAISSYVAARIVAHLTGRTYKHVEFTAEGMYINNDSAKLVAAEDVCSKFESIELALDDHDSLDADDQKARVAA